MNPKRKAHTEEAKQSKALYNLVTAVPGSHLGHTAGLRREPGVLFPISPWDHFCTTSHPNHLGDSPVDASVWCVW